MNDDNIQVDDNPANLNLLEKLLTHWSVKL